jgi:hypothetical protein
MVDSAARLHALADRLGAVWDGALTPARKQA